MSVATLANVDTTIKPVRIPKLAVRNRAPLDDNAITRPVTPTTVAIEGSVENGGQAQSASSSLRASSPGSGRRLSDQSGSGSSGVTGRNGAQERPLTATKPVEVAKKKKSGMLGFLTMKEPSALALEAFAEAERKKAQHKGSLVSAAGVSSRKLPEHVPKVNSKWDGLPESAKRSSTEARSLRSRGDSVATGTSGRRPSTYSSWSNRSDENKRPIGSLSSRPPQSPQFAQRSSLQSRGTVSSTHSARAPIPNDNVHPAFRPIVVEETPENLPQTFLYPPSPPRQRQRASPPRQSSREQQAFTQELPATFGSAAELDSHDGPLLELETSLTVPELDALRSKNATPIPKSPITPSVEDAYATNYYSDSIASAHSANGDTSTFFYSQSDTDHEDFARSSTPKQLRQPINFSRRRTGKARPPSLGKLPEAPSSGFTFIDEQPTFSPTLKNSEGRIDPFLTDTFAAHSRATGKIVERPSETAIHQTNTSIAESIREPVRASMSTYVSSNGIQSPVFSTAPTDSTRPSTAASHTSDGTACEGPDEYYTGHTRRKSDESMAPSIAPSTISAQWTMTPKERLGLGGKIRKGDILPWETVEDLADNSEVIASSTGRRNIGSGGMLSPTATDSKLKRLSYRWGGKR